MNSKTQHTTQMSPKSFSSREEIKRWVNGAKGYVAFKPNWLPLDTKPNPCLAGRQACPLPSGSSIKENEPWQSRRVRELLGDYDTNVSHSCADGNLNVFRNLETQQTAQMSPISFPSREGIKGWVNGAKATILIPSNQPNF